jgi:hypothetical protein
VSKQEGFIMFPISALSLAEQSPDNITPERSSMFLLWIRGYSVWSMYQKLRDVLDGGEPFEFSGRVIDSTAVSELSDRQNCDQSYTLKKWQAFFMSPNDPDQDYCTTSFQAALEMLHMTTDSIQGCGKTIAKFRDVMRKISPHIEHSGGRKWARIRVDLFDDAINGLFTWREFTVLVAVYASLSGSGCMAQKLYYEQLRMMAGGYGGQNIAAAMKIPQDRFLTLKQIRKTIDDLWQRELFAKVPSGRGMWFSIRMKEPELLRYAASVESKLKAKKSAASVKQNLKAQTTKKREGQQRGQLLEKQDIKTGVQEPFNGNSSTSFGAAGGAATRAATRAATGKTSSGETLSGKTSSGKTSRQQNADAILQVSVLEQKVADAPVSTNRSKEQQTLNGAEFSVTMTEQQEVAEVTHSNAQSDPAAFLQTLTPDVQNKLRELQQRQTQRRNDIRRSGEY